MLLADIPDNNRDLIFPLWDYLYWWHPTLPFLTWTCLVGFEIIAKVSLPHFSFVPGTIIHSRTLFGIITTPIRFQFTSHN